MEPLNSGKLPRVKFTYRPCGPLSQNNAHFSQINDNFSGMIADRCSYDSNSNVDLDDESDSDSSSDSSCEECILITYK